MKQADYRPRIAAFAVYMGPLPNYIRLWLRSAGRNTAIDWYLITDQDLSGINFPSNVTPIYATLTDLKRIFERHLGYSIELSTPYKLCDYRPLFWLLLTLTSRADYDFWGHCDVDTYWGDLARYLTANVLLQHDKVFDLGHLSLYRNTGTVNQMYTRAPPALWTSVVTNPSTIGFDEHNGINRVFRRSGLRVYPTAHRVADIDPNDPAAAILPPHLPLAPHALVIWRGRPYISYFLPMGQTIFECAYVHFQKRHFSIVADTDDFCFGDEQMYDLPATATPKEAALTAALYASGNRSAGSMARRARLLARYAIVKIGSALDAAEGAFRRTAAISSHG